MCTHISGKRGGEKSIMQRNVQERESKRVPVSAFATFFFGYLFACDESFAFHEEIFLSTR